MLPLILLLSLKQINYFHVTILVLPILLIWRFIQKQAKKIRGELYSCFSFTYFAFVLFQIMHIKSCISTTDLKARVEGTKIRDRMDMNTQKMENPLVIIGAIDKYDANYCPDLNCGTPDAKMMVSLWRDKYGFKNVYCMNYEKSKNNKWHLEDTEINDYFITMRSELDSGLIDDVDGLILYLSRHGVGKHVLTSNMKKIDRAIINAKFNNQQCAKLRGKPKIFIYDQCRGPSEIKHQMQISKESGSASDTERFEMVNELDDMFIHYST